MLQIRLNRFMLSQKPLALRGSTVFPSVLDLAEYALATNHCQLELAYSGSKGH